MTTQIYGDRAAADARIVSTMSDVVLGAVAVAAGLLLCFRGGLALRALIALWGGFVGFFLGAALVAGGGGDQLLGGPLGWLAGVFGALVLGGLAYAFYALAVGIAMVSVGFGLGSLAAAALGASDGVVTAVGIVTGALLAVLALATGLPYMLLVVVSALGGATAIVAGVMLLVGAAHSADIGGEVARAVMVGQWWWNLAWFVLAAAGVVMQTRARRRVDARLEWAEERR